MIVKYCTRGLFGIRVERYNPSPARRAKTLSVILPDCHLVRLFVHQASHQLQTHEPSNLGGGPVAISCGEGIKTWFTADQPKYQWPTLPETNSSPLKSWMVGILSRLSFWVSTHFQGRKCSFQGEYIFFWRLEQGYKGISSPAWRTWRPIFASGRRGLSGWNYPVEDVGFETY